MNNQSWVSRSVCSHLPISPAALCATTAPLHTELTQTYLKRSESYDHMHRYHIHPAQKVCSVSMNTPHIVLGKIHTHIHKHTTKQLLIWEQSMKHIYTVLQNTLKSNSVSNLQVETLSSLHCSSTQCCSQCQVPLKSHIFQLSSLLFNLLLRSHLNSSSIKSGKWCQILFLSKLFLKKGLFSKAQLLSQVCGCLVFHKHMLQFALEKLKLKLTVD